MVRVRRDLGLDPGTQHSYPRALAVLAGPGRAPRRGDRRGHELREAARRRADPAGGWRTLADRAVVTRLGEGLRRDRRARPGADGADGRRGLRHGPRGAARRRRDVVAVGTAGLRMAVRTARPSSDAVRDALRRPGRGHLRRRGEPAGLRRGDVRGGRAGRRRRRGRDRRRQHPVHFGEGGRIRERFSIDLGRSGSPSATVSTGRSRPPSWRRRAPTPRPPSARLHGRPRPGRGHRHRRGLHQPRGGEARAAAYDPEVVEGTVLDRAEIDRQIERYRTMTADERRTRSSGCSPRAPR